MIFQVVIPFLIVCALFTAGHFFVKPSNSGIYIPEMIIENEASVSPDALEDVDPLNIDPETGAILPDKYNYMKIENVFTGQLKDTNELFSLELALLTKQPSVSSDLFLAALFEIEANVVAEITNNILEVTRSQLSSTGGRKELSNKIKNAVNVYLEQNDMKPAITEVFIINVNII